MTTLTFYGGIKEIGGNKILLEDKDTKVFLDFGMSFGRRAKFFEEYLMPRTANGLGDFLAINLLPDIKGIYRNDLLTHLGRKEEKPEIDAVLVSHAHADHVNYISFLNEEIPIYCGGTTLKILEAIDEQAQRSIENEVIDFRIRPLFKKDYRKPPIPRKFNTFRTGDKFKVGSLEIEPIHVDHSVPGAYGYIIYTSKGPIVYTGDLRLHGNNPDMTYDFMNKAKESKPTAMITEGTRINVKSDDDTEKTVYNRSKKIASQTSNLLIADFNFKDVDRFRTFYKISKEINRKMVISFKHACFLERYHQDNKLKVPDSQDENILILKPKRLTGTYCDEDYTDKYIKCRLNYPNIITAEEISKNQGKYMMILNFWYFNQLVDLKPKKGSKYIHSLSEPFNEEMEMSYGRMQNWLNHFNLHKEHAHCSGHAPGSDLKEMVKTINPKNLFPIHTEHPGMFRELSMKNKMIREGIKYTI
ncbi:MAG: MBL fold metallo-hydrolase [Candidatus Woesearchaeota archaeon]|nr:MAG: MBL fold metallo-hydrolase [Candidatus Woesearchaeota archaeon]